MSQTHKHNLSIHRLTRNYDSVGLGISELHYIAMFEKCIVSVAVYTATSFLVLYVYYIDELQCIILFALMIIAVQLYRHVDINTNMACEFHKQVSYNNNCRDHSMTV